MRKRILVIDVGGTNLKISTTERRESLKIPSGKSMTAARMAAAVREATEGWKYDAVSIGTQVPSSAANPRMNLTT